jgi:hypothetical protein
LDTFAVELVKFTASILCLMSFLSFFGCSKPTKEYQRKWFSMRLPETWKVDEDRESTLLSGPDSYGTLQLWGYYTPSGPLPKEALLSLAGDVVDMGIASRPVTCGDFKGFRFDYPNGKTFFRRWCLQRGSAVVVASYFCPLANRGKADQVVDRMMNTLRGTTSATEADKLSTPPRGSVDDSAVGPDGRVTFKPASLSIKLGNGWTSLGDSETPPVCSPRLLGDPGLIQAMLLPEKSTNLSQAVDELEAYCARMNGTVADSFKRESFTSESGLTGYHLTFTSRLADKSLANHRFIVPNRSGRFIGIEYLSPEDPPSEEVLQAIRKTLRVE